MIKIKGFCRTNLDDYDCDIVKEFVEVPKIGSHVFVRKNGCDHTLEVYQIEHCYSEEIGPYIRIELNKRIL